jgi:hypothetical protein
MQNRYPVKSHVQQQTPKQSEFDQYFRDHQIFTCLLDLVVAIDIVLVPMNFASWESCSKRILNQEK